MYGRPVVIARLVAILAILASSVAIAFGAAVVSYGADTVLGCDTVPAVTGGPVTAVLPDAGTYLGVTVPQGADTEKLLANFESRAGKQAATYLWYLDWSMRFPRPVAETLADRGTIPFLSWDPVAADDPDAVPDEMISPKYELGTISDGDHDAYIRQFAQDARKFCRPVLMRFAPEMNGNWYPWSEGMNNNPPGSFVPAWRHAYDIFQEEGATNVAWVWNPNVLQGIANVDLAALYPGDDYVDFVALDGYNWGKVNEWNSWHSFSRVFDKSVLALREITERPILVGETASTEIGGSKADWIDGMFDYLAANPDIRGFTWFDIQKETDWRINSSQSSQDAYASGAADDYVVGAPVEPAAP